MTPAQMKASYRRMMDMVGEDITLRRYTASGSNPAKTDKTVRARVTGYAPDELVGGITQGDRRIIVLSEDVAAQSFPEPILRSDKVVVRGKELAIVVIDDNTRRLAGTLIAYEFTARG